MEWKIERDTTFSDLLTPRKLLALLAFWLAGILILATYGTVSACLRESAGSLFVVVPAVSSNETGPLSVRCGDPQTTGRSAYRVRFDNLQAERDALESFEAPCHTVVHIDNLDIAFLESSPAEPPTAGRSLLADFRDLLAPSWNGRLYGGAPGLFEDLLGEADGWTVSVDLTNTAEVWVRGRDWRVCRGDETVFQARCEAVQLSAGAPDFTLRGNVIVSANGAVLESDCVQMDARNGRMIVEGPYQLTRGEGTRAGTGACFSTELTFMEPQAPCGPESDAAIAAWAGRQWTDTLTSWLWVAEYADPEYGPSGPDSHGGRGSDLGQEPVFGPLPADFGRLSSGDNHLDGRWCRDDGWGAWRGRPRQ